MDTNNLDVLKILHIGADPEFDSPVIFGNFKVEISTIDNPFSVSQWVSANGLPNAIICEQNIPGGNGFGFHDFWVAQFDPGKSVPFILLDEEKNQETAEKALQHEIDDVYFKPAKAETLISRVLILKETKQPTKKQDSSVQIQEPYKTPFFKRTFDIVLASVGLLVASPILLILIIAIRLESKGRIYDITKRVGSGFMVFDFIRLRAMYTSSDKRMKELAHLNQYLKEASHLESVNSASNDHPIINQETAFAKSENDPRLTRVGHIMRRLNLEELPQLINVIKGDMSIVGNKPLPMYEAELLTTEDWTDRFHGPAGITGLWRIESRRKLKTRTPEERRRLNHKYSKIAKSRFSFWKDMLIIFRSIPSVFRKKNV